MRVVQALHWLRDMLGTDHDRIARRLAAILADPDNGARIAADLRGGLTSLPEGMRSFLRPLLDESRPGAAREKRPKRQAGTR
jgi:hypothetical protein